MIIGDVDGVAKCLLVVTHRGRPTPVYTTCQCQLTIVSQLSRILELSHELDNRVALRAALAAHYHVGVVFALATDVLEDDLV